MYATAGNIPPSRSALMRLLVRSREYRRPRCSGVRVASGIFNLVLGVALLASLAGPLALAGGAGAGGGRPDLLDRLPPAGQCPELASEERRRHHSRDRPDPSVTTCPDEIPGQVVGIPPPPAVGGCARRRWHLQRRPWRPPARFGRWLGPLAALAALPLAGAALIFWTVYRLQQDSVQRVRELEQSRADLVEDSAARLRRIERDLHDGAQAQMVAVTMKLGWP